MTRVEALAGQRLEWSRPRVCVATRPDCRAGGVQPQGAGGERCAAGRAGEGVVRGTAVQQSAEYLTHSEGCEGQMETMTYLTSSPRCVLLRRDIGFKNCLVEQWSSTFSKSVHTNFLKNKFCIH